MQKDRLRIAIIGTRGIPANYGGFETFVEEVGQRLVIRGHVVDVYCRNGYGDYESDTYQGMKRICAPYIRINALETLSHTFSSVIYSLSKKYDVYIVCNVANAICLLPLRIAGKKILLNTDGLEWKRSKWGSFAKNFFLFSENIAKFIATRLISDCHGIQSYYRKVYNAESSVIPYGAYAQESVDKTLLDQFGLKENEYYLQITRFEPENNPLLTIEAFKKAKSSKKLVLVGGSPYPTKYLSEIRRAADSETILLPGYIYDADVLRELWCNAYAYIHGNEVGGTNPALLQSMASGCFILCRDVPFNRDVLGGCGIYYKKDIRSLAEKIQYAEEHPGILEKYKIKVRQRITAMYSWDDIADMYDDIVAATCNESFFPCPLRSFRWKPEVIDRNVDFRDFDRTPVESNDLSISVASNEHFSLITGYVLNISLGGIAARFSQEVDALIMGRHVQITLNAKDQSSPRINAQICWSDSDKLGLKIDSKHYDLFIQSYLSGKFAEGGRKAASGAA